METLTERAIPAPPGVVEVLNRSGAVVQRLPLATGTLRLGRDLGNDLILDSPYVSPHHALLREEGGRLVVDDLGSVNGVSRVPGGARSDHLELASGESLSIGRTMLRYRNAAAPLPPTLVDRHVASPLRQFERPAILAVLYLLAPGLLLFSTYLETFTRLQIGKLLLTPVIASLMLLLWAALWAFSSRILSYRWHFAVHLGIGCAGLIALLLLETINGYLCFALNFDHAQGVLEHLGQTALLAFLLFSHLRFVSAAPSRTLARAATLISVVVLGITLLPAINEQNEFNSAPSFQVTLKSPVFKIVARQDAELFFEKAQSIPAELAKRAAEGKE